MNLKKVEGASTEGNTGLSKNTAKYFSKNVKGYFIIHEKNSIRTEK